MAFSARAPDLHDRMIGFSAAFSGLLKSYSAAKSSGDMVENAADISQTEEKSNERRVSALFFQVDHYISTPDWSECFLSRAILDIGKKIWQLPREC